MDVQVIDRLPTMLATVDDQAIPALIDPFLNGKLIGDGDHVTDQAVVFRLEVADGLQVDVGNDQNMDGSLRLDVSKCRHQLILIDDVCGHLACDDTAENAVHNVSPFFLFV